APPAGDVRATVADLRAQATSATTASATAPAVPADVPAASTAPARTTTVPVAPEPARPRASIWTDQTVAGISHVALIGWVVIVCAPLLWVLMSSFKTTQQIFGSPFSLPTSFNF